ncbi:MAG TPA: gliding motility-associated C-terminal domain-containing protein [Williamwhitmania sp.]|nr:gliding motility-associated C-terminal domain-containing protein [Williamwhitmania sp.]
MKRLSTLLRLSFLLCFLLFSAAILSAQTLYWVNGSGSWNDGSHWSLTSGGNGGAGVPTLSNDVVFNKKSFTEKGAVVSITAQAYCNNLTWKGTEKFAPSLQGGKSSSLLVSGLFVIKDQITNSFQGKLVFLGSDKQQIKTAIHFPSVVISVNAEKNLITEPNLRSSKVELLPATSVIGNSLPQRTSGPLRSGVSSINPIGTDVSCFGLSDGTLTITVAGGTPNYTYQIFDLGDITYNFTQIITDLTPAVFTNLRAATYIISVKDGSGTVQTSSYTINQPNPLTLVASTTNITCNGANDGKVTATASGGTTNYTYTLKDGATVLGSQTSSGSVTFTGLPAGVNYSVDVDDSHSCGPVTQGPLTIIDPVALGGSITAHTDILCFGALTGSITATATNGTSPYQYNIDGGSYQASGTFNGLAAGSHTVTVQDVNGCTFSIPPYILTQPASGVSGSISSQTNVSCNGGNDGSVTVAGSGGTSPYQYSLNGGAYQGSGTFGTLTAGSYTVTVQDAGGCTYDVPVIITQPTALGGGITAQTNVGCNGGNNGSVTVAGSGGTSPYQYSLNGGAYQASGTFATLTAGSYTVTVRDINGCTHDVPVTITEPTTLTGSITSQTNVACNGGNTGSVTVAGSGGTAPYQYSLNGGTYQASGTFSSLTAGSYTVTVMDANGCTYNVPVTITQPATPVSGSISSQTNVSCFGGNNGSVTVAGAGGTSPYQYNLNGGTFQVSGTFGTLITGAYTVTVKDANGCTFDVPVTITQPATALSGSIPSQTNVLCFGTSTGSVTVAGSGGTSPYQYSLNGGAYQGSGTFSTLAAGSYTVTVRDANSCTFDVPVTITQPATALSGSITGQTNVLCFGDNTGSVTVTGTGGSSPYQFSLNGGGYQASGTFNGLTSGAYTVTVRDANSCTYDVAVNITEPANALTGSISSQTDVACFGASTGSVTVTGVNGTLPYQYSFDGGAYAATSTFSSLAAGSYTVTVKDANGCLATIPVTIAQPAAALSGSISSQTNVACFGGNTGTVTAAGTGGTAPYQYSLNGGAYQASGTFATLIAGSYTITVRDANSCTVDVPVTITQPAASLSAAISAQTNVSCFGGNSGSVTVAGAGGTAPYQYSLNGGAYQASGTFGTLIAGSYTVTVRDANSCTFDVPVTITQPASALTGSITSQTNLTCNGGNDGAVTVAAAGGTSPYSYNIDGGTYGASATFSSLIAGNHTVGIQDANGCTTTVPVTLTEPPAIIITSETVVNVTGCFGNTNGSITIVASGGTGVLSYSIDGGTTYQATGNFTNLAAGTYQVMVKDASDCLKTGSLLDVTQPAQVTFTFTTQDLTCNGSANGEIHFTASGGTPPYQYSILGGTSSSWKASPDFTGLTAGTYSLKVRDANGCTTVASIAKILQPAAIATDGGTWQDVTTCNGDNTGSITVKVTGGVPPFSFSINGGTTWQATGEFLNLFAGTYSVIVKDGNGCTTTVGPNTINEPSKITISAEIVDDVTVCWYNTDGSIVVLATGGTGDLQFSIDGGTTWQTDGFFNNLGVGTYQVAVKDDNGCIKNGSLLTVAGPPPIVIDPTTTTTNISCNGSNDGQINVVATGGTGALSYSLNGGPGQATGLFPGLTAGSYTVTVTDANLCTLDYPVTLTEPTAITYTSQNFTNVTCNGANDGTITIVVSGGSAPYDYSIDGGTTFANTTGFFTGLTGGTYNVVVKDANGCTANGNAITIVDPAAISIDASSASNSGCFGSNTGTISVLASGGTAPLTFNLKDGTATIIASNTSGTFTGLAPDTYTVEVVDVNGCGPVIAGPFTISEATALTATSVKTDITCNGDVNGTITITASGGTPPYQYSFDDGATFGATNTATNLAGGDYYLFVKDANGCMFADTVNIFEPDVLTITLNPTNPSCSGMTIWDGKIVATSTGGTYSALSPKLFKLDGGAWTTTPTFNNVTPGPHTVTVKDAKGCTALANVTLVAPAPVTIGSQSSVDPTCTTLGSITVTALGGTGHYTYVLSPGGATNITGIFTGLGGGTYTVSITDSLGCGPVTTGNIVLVSPTTLHIDAVNITDVTGCYGNTNGALEIITSGGTGTIVYSIDGGATWGNTNIFTNLSGGTYSIQVNDANNCITGTLAQVQQPNQIVITVDQLIQPTPSGNDGEIDVSATGGTGTLTYVLTPGGTSNTTGVFTGLAAGNYSVTVNDNNGCSATVTDLLLNDFSATITSTDLTCNGVSDGTITLTIYGSSNPTVSWTKDGIDYNTEMNAKYDGNGYKNLDPGTYVATVTDVPTGRIIVLPAVTINDAPAIVISSVDTPTYDICAGKDQGAITINASGGTGSLDYSVDNDVTYQSSNIFTNLLPGDYNVYVKDGNGCKVAYTANPINFQDAPEKITATLDPSSVSDITCPTDSTGSLVVNVAGGVPTYTYSWDDGTTDLNRTDLPIGTYSLTITDQNSCNLTQPFSITGPPMWDASAVIDSAVCKIRGYDIGQINATVNGATPGYTYSWTVVTDDPNIPQIADTDLNIDNLRSFDSNGKQIGYRLNVVDSKACAYSQTFYVPYTTRLHASIITKPFVCAGVQISLMASGSDINMSLNQWFGLNARGTSIDLSAYNGQPLAQAIIDTLTTFNLLLTDNTGECQDLATALVTVYPKIGVEIIKDFNFDGDTLVVLANSPYEVASDITTANMDVVYYWKDPALFNPVDNSISNILVPQSYTFYKQNSKWGYTQIYAMAEDTATSCVDSVAVPVKVLKLINIPNAFSPNGDGIHDTWEIWDVTGVPISALFPQIEVEIFNRWGSRVFYSKGYEKPWNGKAISGGDLPVGTYYYVIKFNKEGYGPQVGSVTILR